VSPRGAARTSDPLPPQQPIVIAHRGASGYLPEHTLEAKALAYGFGADYLEQDVIATRDGHLVVLHDVHLDDVTDVARQFPGRQRTDGRHYAIDFDLAELRRLRVSERRAAGSASARFPGRFPTETGEFRIATLHEELAFVAGLNRSSGRNVGVYSEIKDPSWHHAHGIDLARAVVDQLAAHGYRGSRDRAFVQCFDAVELRRVADELHGDLPLVQLVEPAPAYAELLTDAGLARVATYADALGPSFAQLVTAAPAGGGLPRPSPLAAAARQAGLMLHPYTFRRDELPPYAPDFETLLTLFFAEIGVDGLFSDHPDVAVRVRDAVAQRKGSAVTGDSL
jgi:glycerophosphoryl diester phosphodiesterase